MDSNGSKANAVSSEVTVDEKASPSDLLNSESESEDDYDQPVEEEEEEEDPDYRSGNDSDYSTDDNITKKPSSGSVKSRKDAQERREGSDSEEEEEDDDDPETNLQRFMEVLHSREVRQREKEQDRKYVAYENRFNFPKDRERWSEEDLQEFWAEAPLSATKPGWDPVSADKDDWQVVCDEIKAGRDPSIAPFYVPYYKYYPSIPDNHHDISNPKSVIEELDRIEEFLNWVSYIFQDGSSYEGTVWDDLAHGKGVYVAKKGLVRYEGEWFQNVMDGHGVVEVDIPDIQPRPGSKLEAKMRSEGKIIKRDFMSQDDQKWLDMDIDDTVRLRAGRSVIPYYEKSTWIRVFGEKPEKGRYKYAGQWKHGKMHGCGVYEVNEQIIYGRFYFGEYLDDSTGCDADISAMHAGIAEVAAAKARMFVNKPDGMVREKRGPYGDPQHPYFYEDEDMWMAPGFINQFYETPDYWKTYVEEVDQEKEMWLNSFYKAPLRIPMPAELEYWWEKDEGPEFVLIEPEPEPDAEDPSKFIETEPLILHTRTGRLINYVEDEKYGIRLFWHPNSLEEVEDEEGVNEDANLNKVAFLPLGFDDFYGRTKCVVRRDSWLLRRLKSFQKAVLGKLEQLEKWVDEKRKDSESKMKTIDDELDFAEAEIRIEEGMEEIDAELKRNQREEEKKASQMDLEESFVPPSPVRKEEEEKEEDSEEEEEDDDEETPSSFGIASTGVPATGSTKEGKNGRPPVNSPFSSLTLSWGTFALATQVPKKVLTSFFSRNQGSLQPSARGSRPWDADIFKVGRRTVNVSSISYPGKQLVRSLGLRMARKECDIKHNPVVRSSSGDVVTSGGAVLKRRLKVKSSGGNNSWHHADRRFRGGPNSERHPLCVLSLPVLCPQTCCSDLNTSSL